jgi:hypothetical protein
MAEQRHLFFQKRGRNRYLLEDIQIKISYKALRETEMKPKCRLCNVLQCMEKLKRIIALYVFQSALSRSKRLFEYAYDPNKQTYDFFLLSQSCNLSNINFPHKRLREQNPAVMHST